MATNIKLLDRFHNNNRYKSVQHIEYSREEEKTDPRTRRKQKILLLIRREFCNAAQKRGGAEGKGKRRKEGLEGSWERREFCLGSETKGNGTTAKLNTGRGIHGHPCKTRIGGRKRGREDSLRNVWRPKRRLLGS